MMVSFMAAGNPDYSRKWCKGSGQGAILNNPCAEPWLCDSSINRRPCAKLQNLGATGSPRNHPPDGCLVANVIKRQFRHRQMIYRSAPNEILMVSGAA